MRDWLKIALAGAAGGSAFCITTFVLGLSHLWVAFPIGFLAGYLAYEFREVCSIATGLIGEISRHLWHGIMAWAKGHYSFIIISSPVWGGGTFFLVSALMAERDPDGNVMSVVTCCVWSLVILSVLLSFATSVAEGVAQLGARRQNAFFTTGSKFFVEEQEIATRQLRDAGYREVELDFRNVVSWIVGGCFEIFFFFATLWLYIFPLCGWIFKTVAYVIQCVIRLLAFIHSDERMMCGSGGMIGGYAAYVLFWDPSLTLAQRTVYVLAGAIMGAGAALLEWKASKVFARRRAPVSA